MKITFVYFSAIVILLMLSSFTLLPLPTYGQRIGDPSFPPEINNYGEIDSRNQNGILIEVSLIAPYGIRFVELNIRDADNSFMPYLQKVFDLSKRMDGLNRTGNLQPVQEGVYEVMVPILLYPNVNAASAYICVDILHSLYAPLCDTVSREVNYIQSLSLDLAKYISPE
jgi:hypothetical protein